LPSISQKKQLLKSILHNISTIIFDLGGVVIDLDTQCSVSTFAKYSGLTEKEVYARFLRDKWSYAFEKGEISEESFRNNVRRSLDKNLSDQQIDEAWNAILQDLPSARLQILTGLRNDYQTMVLSNTNAIHVREFDKIVAATTNGQSINDYFDKVYYSHELGMRKPDTEIFAHVIQTNNLKPQETLFIDDLENNISSARAVGLRTIHLTNQKLEELFFNG
jgi:glucose-1-phosphatase